MTETTALPTGSRAESAPSPARVRAEPAPIPSGCSLCYRDNIKLQPYAFGEAPQNVRFVKGKMIIEDNPNYIPGVILCSTDTNLIARLKRDRANANLSSPELYELAKQYRRAFPIQEK